MTPRIATHYATRAEALSNLEKFTTAALPAESRKALRPLSEHFALGQVAEGIIQQVRRPQGHGYGPIEYQLAGDPVRVLTVLRAAASTEEAADVVDAALDEWARVIKTEHES